MPQAVVIPHGRIMGVTRELLDFLSFHLLRFTFHAREPCLNTISKNCSVDSQRIR